MVQCLSEQSGARAALVRHLAPLMAALQAFVAPSPAASPDPDEMRA